jgi:hypothetical protein
MRTLLLIAALLGFSMQAQAAEPQAYDSALPRDAASLSKLDEAQLRLVRRATNQCDVTDPAMVTALNPARRPCIITRVDTAVATSGDPALQAFHAALPQNARYDRYRPSYYWQRMALKTP